MALTNGEHLERLEPGVRIRIDRMLVAIGAKGYSPRIIESRRTHAEQREKVRKGYSKTMNSEHLDADNKAPFLGRAADIVEASFRPLQGWTPRHVRFFLILGSAANWQSMGWGGLFGLSTAQRRRLLARIRELSKAGWPKPDPTTGYPYNEFGLTASYKYRVGWDPNHVQKTNNWPPE